ncbi:acetylxylan esterase [Chitinophagaceae bacterium MMS25-I14]
MNKLRKVYPALLFAFSSLTAAAQDTNRILDWKTAYTLNTFLVQRMHQQYAKRKSSLQNALLSPQNLAAYQQQCRRKYKELTGAMRAGSTLNSVTTIMLQRSGYKIEKVIYESFPHHHVTANLYVPDGKGKFPAVLFFCGHENESKATISYQQTAILFARNGFEVLVVDPVSQAERYQLTDSSCKLLTRGGTTEHTLLNAAASLTGSSIAAYELYDNIRSLDYLISRKEVDTSRIGCAGNSGGGMQTIYFAGYDNRIKIAAPCSYLAARDRTMELTGPADGCAQMPGEGKEQLEMADYLISFAPKPLLILAGRYDFIDYTGTEQAYGELKRVYKTLHNEKALEMFTADDGHGISKPKREATVSWFRKWFYNDTRPVKETTTELCNTAELNCTQTGQVCSDYADEISIPDDVRKQSESFSNQRKKFLAQAAAAAFQDTLKKLLGIEPYKASLSVEETGTLHFAEYDVHNMILRQANEIPMPVQVIYPQQPGKKTIILLDDRGRQVFHDSTGYITGLLKQGFAVLMPDLRGIGETSDLPSANDPKYYNREYRNAMLSQHIGYPLPGQRAKDILTLLHFTNTDSVLRKSETQVIASGNACGTAALYATVLDSSIASLDLYHTIDSFEAILAHPEAKNWYSCIVPGALKIFDLPDLILIAGKRVSVHR